MCFRQLIMTDSIICSNLHDLLYIYFKKILHHSNLIYVCIRLILVCVVLSGAVCRLSSVQDYYVCLTVIYGTFDVAYTIFLFFICTE